MKGREWQQDIGPGILAVAPFRSNNSWGVPPARTLARGVRPPRDWTEILPDAFLSEARSLWAIEQILRAPVDPSPSPLTRPPPQATTLASAHPTPTVPVLETR